MTSPNEKPNTLTREILENSEQYYGHDTPYHPHPLGVDTPMPQVSTSHTHMSIRGHND